jgi:hypothetical protein
MRKCGCPFQLRRYFHATKEWHLIVGSGIHNHELDKELDGHLVVGRLKARMKEARVEMTRNLVQPRNSMSTLKERYPDNVTSIKQIYNDHYRLKVKTRGSRTEMQQILKLLKQNKYVIF